MEIIVNMAVQVFKVDRKVGPSKLLIASANPTVGMPTVLAMNLMQ